MAHALVIDKGLSIAFNGRPLGKRALTFLESNQLKPAFYEKSYKQFGNSVINARIYAGISERDYAKGGWYIFCNGRMVLEADQTSITTWGVNNMVKYHPDYAFFRGFVFFDSDDAELLPWTTTKTGIDADSSFYNLIRLEMINTIRPILKFCRNLATERALVKNEEIETSPLEESYKETKEIDYSDLKEKGNFIAPEIFKIKRGPRIGRIQYNKPLDDINKLKKILRVTSNKAVGEKTFDYFVEMECEE
jgi:hypothetical protein